MSSGDSSSQNPSIYRRKPADQSDSPSSYSDVGVLSPLNQPAQAPDYRPGALSISSSAVPYSIPVPSLLDDQHPAHVFPIPLHQQNAATSLDSEISRRSLLLPSSAPPSGQRAQPSYSVDYTGPSTIEQAHGLGITPHPMSVASDTYLAGSIMQPNSQQYAWGHRPFHPQQPPSEHMNQQYPLSQSYPASGFPVSYAAQSGAVHNYHQESPSPSYLPGAPGSAQHSQSRSPSMTRPLPPHPAGPMSDQSLMAGSPPYMMNQPGYYLPEASPVHSPHTPSMTSQTPSIATQPVFSSSESIPPTDTNHQVRVVSSRPRPQCWDHGCNGREFSTFSNLLRHQREKSGVVAKAECPVCGAVFTRTTARNIHVAQGKCKGPGRESSAESTTR